MRPKSEGFVRKAESRRRAKRPSGTYVRTPATRTPAQKAQVRRDAPRLTPNARLAQGANAMKRRALRDWNGELASRGWSMDKSLAERSRIARKALRDNKARPKADALLKASREAHDAMKWNQQDFQRRVGGTLPAKPSPAPRPATVKRSDGRDLPLADPNYYPPKEVQSPFRKRRGPRVRHSANRKYRSV